MVAADEANWRTVQIKAGMFEIFKALVSGVFAGMANDQATRRDYRGTKWRANMALRWASNPYSLTLAHAVTAKAELLGNHRHEAKRNVERALALIDATPEIQELEEIEALASELQAMRNGLI
jgi:hypothetical protein